jgi:hypothetical protein
VRRICHMAYFCRLGSYFWGRTSENFYSTTFVNKAISRFRSCGGSCIHSYLASLAKEGGAEPP